MTLAGGDDESTPLPPFTAAAAVCLDMMAVEPSLLVLSVMDAGLAWKGKIFHRKVRYEKQIQMTTKNSSSTFGIQLHCIKELKSMNVSVRPNIGIEQS